jgi:hypothetical protein
MRLTSGTSKKRQNPYNDKILKLISIYLRADVTAQSQLQSEQKLKKREEKENKRGKQGQTKKMLTLGNLYHLDD